MEPTSHRKSRNGCITCKQRHIKCNERLPKCSNCDISEKDCRYPAPRKAKTGASPYEQELTSSTWLHTASTSRKSQSPAPSDDLHKLESEELFTFDHLKLLYHVHENMMDWMMVTEELKPLARFNITSALKTPFLMNQLLALSALHLRTVKPELEDWYKQTAAQLRNRAMRGFKKSLHDTSNSNAISQFLFSSLLALHYLVETVADAPGQDFPSTLRYTLEYFRLQRGARIMGDRSWSTISQSMLGEHLSTTISRFSGDQQTPSEACGLISTMLERSELNQESREACEEAGRVLGSLSRQVQVMGVHALMVWSNIISSRFLMLLERQIPEALVILAHYAVLLHQYKAFWCFGNVGKRLVDGISTLLAGYWANWLPSLEDEGIRET
ncbi:hypothetical protein B0J13DRAFT_595249 [Dactylonectria estremocensis]|uniref:Zn(2)-C6 fungal-type domain-containing protein n=1 Tax=Dactylonectria estremocensis TaxID=1079267 RepID=A0A9P9EXK9_9HYPO|nr:hypothetical protein B0J13DRAFT_595249 [Dactylonectria estremocensis]